MIRHKTTSGFAFAVMLVASAGWVQAGVITSTNSSEGFFDASYGYRSFVFNSGNFGGGSSIVTDVNLSISFAKSNDNSFVDEGNPINTGNGYLNEIEFTLFSPSGTAFTLISNDRLEEPVSADSFETFSLGRSGSFKGTVLFDQQAASAVDVSSSSMTAGTFRPDDDTLNSLDIFNGESALGTWTLLIEDDVSADGLSFYEASLTVTTPDASTVPEPTSLAIFGISALGLVCRQRRRL